MSSSPGEITKLLIAWRDGDPDAMNYLLPLVVDDLRRIAGKVLAKRGRDLTYEATELVSVIYLRLVGQKRAKWKNRQQFFKVCAEFVRRTLIERAIQKRAVRHGGGATRVPLDDSIDRLIESVPVGDGQQADLIALDNALKRLAELDPQAVKIIEYRFFFGLTIEETAAILEVCTMTVSRDWETSKRWLFRELSSKSSKLR